LIPYFGLFVLLAGAFVLKTAVFWQLRDNPLLSPDAGLDTTAYAQLASRVAGGDLWLGPGLYFVSPLYIYFLAAGLVVLRSFTLVRFAQIVLGVASVGGIFVMTREWFGVRAAWVASALAALTGLFTFYESLILQASIDPFLTSAALASLAVGLNRNRARWITLAGVVFGIQTLNRPNVLLAAGAVVVLLALIRRLRFSALLAAGIAIGMLPALARNVTVAHQWTFVSSHGGLNFYIGNSATATGFYQAVPGITPTIGGQETDARRVAEQARGRQLSDSEVSGYFYELSRRWIAARPSDAAKLFARKLLYVFNAAHVALPHSYPFYAYDERTLLRLLVVGPWLLIPLGLIGLALPLARERNPLYLAWAAFVPAYAIAVAVFFVAERYRLPLLVPLAAGAGAASDRFVVLARERRFARLALPAAALAALFAVVNFPLGLDDGRWQEGLRLAQRLVILGRYGEADAWAARIESREPAPGATEHGVGAQLVVEKQFARAVPHLERAVADGYRRDGIEYQLGEALLESGRPADAVPHFRTALDAQPNRPVAAVAYARALQESGDTAAALDVLHRVQLPDSADAGVWAMAGRVAAMSKAPEAAEPFFERAAQLAPDDAAVRQQHGLNLLVLERIPDAARELAAAARLDPRNPDTLSRLAYCELKLGRVDDARRHAQAALALNPADPLARELLRALGS
jgi:tetratricopeptide (TPR) repeat protein